MTTTSTSKSTSTENDRHEPFLEPMQGQAELLRSLLEPLLDVRGIELVQLFLVQGQNKAQVRLFVDKKAAGYGPGQGIGIDELEQTSKVVGDYLDVEDTHRNLFKGRYELEVSSPGVDRPLTKKSHFRKAQGSKVKVKSRRPIEGSRSFAGPLVDVSDDAATIDVDGKRVAVPFTEITSAHVQFVFDDPKRPEPKRKNKSKTKAAAKAARGEE